jgi:hypothetical protein
MTQHPCTPGDSRKLYRSHLTRKILFRQMTAAVGEDTPALFLMNSSLYQPRTCRADAGRVVGL